jgi:hypothetical protein
MKNLGKIFFALIVFAFASNVVTPTTGYDEKFGTVLTGKTYFTIYPTDPLHSLLKEAKKSVDVFDYLMNIKRKPTHNWIIDEVFSWDLIKLNIFCKRVLKSIMEDLDKIKEERLVCSDRYSATHTQPGLGLFLFMCTLRDTTKLYGDLVYNPDVWRDRMRGWFNVFTAVNDDGKDAIWGDTEERINIFIEKYASATGKTKTEIWLLFTRSFNREQIENDLRKVENEINKLEADLKNKREEIYKIQDEIDRNIAISDYKEEKATIYKKISDLNKQKNYMELVLKKTKEYEKRADDITAALRTKGLESIAAQVLPDASIKTGEQAVQKAYELKKEEALKINEIQMKKREDGIRRVEEKNKEIMKIIQPQKLN